jgi:hypothetical protein
MKASLAKQHTKSVKKGLRGLAKEIRKLYESRVAEGGPEWRVK